MIALAALVFLSAITPGPNNLVLLQHGATRGVRAGLPAGLGISLGGCLMLAAVWSLMAAAGPWLATAAPLLAVASALVLVSMAVSLWRSAPGIKRHPPSLPMGLWAMAAFQLVNPKAWSFLASLAGTQFAARSEPASLGAMLAVFALTSLFCSAVWLMAGQALQRWLSVARRARGFNRVMAAALAGLAIQTIASVPF